MAKRKKKKFRQKQQRIQAKQQASRPKELISEATRLLNNGRFAEAIHIAESALSKKSGGEMDARATKILVESLFRSAAKADTLSGRLTFIDSALGYAPNDARLHFHKGSTLMRQGKGSAALTALDKAAQLGYSHPQLPYIRSLAQQSAGTKPHTDELPADQAGILQILDGVTQKKEADELLAQVDMHVPADQRVLWSGLVKMATSKSAVPVKALQKASTTQSAVENPLLHYYFGVAALRNKETGLARSAWSSTTALEAAWFTANAGNLLSEEILEFGRNEAWDEVLASVPRLEDLPVVRSNKAVQEVISTAYFHRGNQLVERQAWFDAIDAWEKASEQISNRLLLQNLALAHEATEAFGEAAESWRAMIKRRPRKKDHPDYLSDEQVSVIWSRAAANYVFEENLHEAISCLKNAIKYDEENIKMRLALVDAYMEDDRIEAAINEAHRILEIDEKNVPALEYLGALYANDEWRYDTSEIWQRLLAIDPSHQEARDTLAQEYIERAEFSFHPMLRLKGGASLLSGLRRDLEDPIDILKKALKEIPNHPQLLLHIGAILMREQEEEEARDYFHKAWQAKPGDLSLAIQVIANLINADGDALVHELLQQLKQLHRLRSTFWVAMVKTSIDAEHEAEWIELFLNEALATVESGQGNIHPLEILLEVFDYAMDEDEVDLGAEIADRIRKEEPNEGGPEYVDARLAAEMDGDTKKALKLIRKAITKMRKSKHEKLAKEASMLESMLSGQGHPFQELEEKLVRFGFDLNGPEPTPEEFMKFLQDADEETVNELRKLIGF